MVWYVHLLGIFIRITNSHETYSIVRLYVTLCNLKNYLIVTIVTHKKNMGNAFVMYSHSRSVVNTTVRIWQREETAVKAS